MAEKKNRKCAVCRTEYIYCNRCQEDKDKPTWYFTFCSSNCKDIYDVTSKFENGRLTSDKAKKILNKLDLLKLDSFGDSYKSSIEKINMINEVSELEVVALSEMDTIEDVAQPFLTDDEIEIKKPKKKAKKNVE